MKLIKNKKTNIIEFGFDDDNTPFYTTLDSIVVNGTEFKYVNPNNYTEIIVTGQTLPSNFVQNLYHYEGGVWKESCLLLTLLDGIRKQRNKLLAESDWTQMPDVTLPNKTDWDTYRQALRDLPANITNPFTVEWPKDPNWVDVTF